ncbi:MAG TPA: ABC transporter permease subunit [Yinghuangia sp.]|nr:ABC transporter permease subunit [Yinghuangia sp.]
MSAGPAQAGARPGSVTAEAGRARRHACRAEFAKSASLHSTWWLLLAVAGLTVVLGAAAVGTVDTDQCRTPSSCHEDTVKLSLTGVWVGQTAVAVFGVLAVAGEYGTGTMRVTLAAMPDRTRVVAAKASVVAALTAVSALLAVAGSVAVGRVLLSDAGFTRANGYEPLSLADGATARAAFGSVVYLMLVALLSVGLAFVVRDTAGAIGGVLGLLYAFPVAASLVSDDAWKEWLTRLAPASAGLAVQSTRDLDKLAIAPWPGLGVLSLYAAGALVLGGFVLCRRDA